MNKTLALATTILLFAGTAVLPAQEKSAKGLKVTEAKLGKDVQNKKIVDTTSTFALDEKAYLWMRLTGGPADSITVTWKTGSQTYPSRLNVGGTPWRTWSYKTLADTGAWTVTVTDAEGNVLKEMNFEVTGAKTKQ
ncbi:MAG TPA: DUF2914 domain-containing protein [Bacteroidota bacterium]|nr:DUF2914 domain-containing protein [Bacteroidota bacterium]